MAALGPTIQLNNGITMPALGFGTFAHKGSKGETHQAVIAALEAGYRHLDSAWIYENEDEVGSAVQEFLAANPGVQRSDIFITTKVWQHLHEPEDVEWSLNDSLRQLQTESAPMARQALTLPPSTHSDDDAQYAINKALTQDPVPTWRAMERLVRLGKARAIGVSNWTMAGLSSLLRSAAIRPAVNQIEIHPFLPNTALVDFCFAHQVFPVAYSPLGSQDQVPSTGEKVMDNLALRVIAERNGASIAQVLIAWGLQRGYAVLPKSSNGDRIRSNARLITLSHEDFEAVNRVAEGRHVRFLNMKDTFGYDVWPEEA
ncbi:hypothetical protein B7463_g4228, partial [Scytalidium lignicola]